MKKIVFIFILSLLISCKNRQSNHHDIDLIQIEIVKDMHSSSTITIIPNSKRYIINNRQEYTPDDNEKILPSFESISVDSIPIMNVLNIANEILQENTDTVICEATDIWLYNKYPLVITFNFVHKGTFKSYITLLKTSSFNSKEKMLLIEILNTINNFSKDSTNIKYSNKIKEMIAGRS